MSSYPIYYFFVFFFNDTATTEIYTLSLHDALPIYSGNFDWAAQGDKFKGLTTPDESYHGLTYTKTFGNMAYCTKLVTQLMRDLDRKSTRLNSSHANISYAVFCLKKKNTSK